MDFDEGRGGMGGGLMKGAGPRHGGGGAGPSDRAGAGEGAAMDT